MLEKARWRESTTGTRFYPQVEGTRCGAPLPQKPDTWFCHGSLYLEQCWAWQKHEKILRQITLIVSFVMAEGTAQSTCLIKNDITWLLSSICQQLWIVHILVGNFTYDRPTDPPTLSLSYWERTSGTSVPLWGQTLSGYINNQNIVGFRIVSR